MIFRGVTIGLMVSLKNTFAVQVELFPLASLTVTVTGFAPSPVLQLKVLGVALKVRGRLLHASVVPLSNKFGLVMVAIPCAFTFIVMSFTFQMGPALSFTVINTMQVLELPHAFVAM